MYVSLPSTSLYRKTLLGTQLYIKHYKMKQKQSFIDENTTVHSTSNCTERMMQATI